MKLIVNENQYKNLIKEARGYSKSAESWAHIVVDEIMKYIFNIDSEDTIPMTKLSLKYKHRDFFKDLPIESIIIDIITNKTETEEGFADASYIPHWSHLEDDVIDNGEVLEDVEFALTITLPDFDMDQEQKATVKDYLFKIFTHELLHVYEWYKRGLKEPADKKNCMGLFTDGDLHGNIVERIAYLIYAQLSFEVNAFIHQASSILKSKGIKTYDEFLNELHGLFIWDFVEEMVNFNSEDAIKEIKNISKKDMDLLNDIKVCFYSYKDEDDELMIKNKNVKKSMKSFFNDLEKKFRIRGEGMKRKLYKISTDIL